MIAVGTGEYDYAKFHVRTGIGSVSKIFIINNHTK